GRDAEAKADRRYQVVRGFGSLEKAIGKPSTKNRSRQSANDGACAEQNAGIAQAVAVYPVQKRRHPDLQAAEREGHHRHTEGCREECRIAEQSLQRVTLGRLMKRVVEIPQRWLWDEEQQECQQHTGS